MPALPHHRLLPLATALLALAGAAGAAPESGPRGEARADPDPITQLLQHRGLLLPSVPTLPSVPAMAEAAAQGARQLRDLGGELVVSALAFVGLPYRLGGSSAELGFDCSGFTRHVFEQSLGLVLPRRSDEQARAAGLAAVARDALQPGDLVFFNTRRRAFSHVGIYVGEGRFVHAPRAGALVRVESMASAYWARRFDGARRAERNAAAAPQPGG